MPGSNSAPAACSTIKNMHAQARTRALAALARLEPRIRQDTSRLVEQLLLGWQELRMAPGRVSTVKSPAAMSTESRGTTVGRYQIRVYWVPRRRGEVYKALDATLGRPVALKVLRRELKRNLVRLGRFLHGGGAASALNHLNFPSIHQGWRSRCPGYSWVLESSKAKPCASVSSADR